MTNPSHTELAAQLDVLLHKFADACQFGIDSDERAASKAIRDFFRAALESPERVQGEAFHEALHREAEDCDIPVETVESIFKSLLPGFLADKEEAGYITLPLDSLIEADSYGVWGSDFYRCRICQNESGAGVLNNGIEHEGDCPLRNDARAPTPPTAPAQDAQGELLHARVIDRIWKECQQKGLDHVAFAWHIQRAALRASSPADRIEADEALMRTAAEALEHAQNWFSEDQSSYADCHAAITALRKRLESSK